MNIILVSNKMAKAKTLSTWHIALMATMLMVACVMITLQFSSKQKVSQPAPVQPLADIKAEARAEAEALSQSHLDAYAKQLGELQARILRLDAQNKRLARLAGEKVPADITAETLMANEPESQEVAGHQGGPFLPEQSLSEEGLQQAIENLISTVDLRDAYQNKLEAKILQNSVLKDMLPNSAPIAVKFRSSSYGWRTDPFRGTKAFHEGLDFPARMGTPIFAAADGIVITSGRTSAYGNLVKVDHGAGLETRYAHASKLLVKVGERVVKGQKIALVGSTGRSTGPHLHYEIRLHGNSLDPRQYLDKKNS